MQITISESIDSACPDQLGSHTGGMNAQAVQVTSLLFQAHILKDFQEL
ncbi:hypothetical protein KM900_18035 [Bacillus subtilis]|nr:hypothetical protein [Bacillus subtilis]MBU8572428.1 hypothetical protein [Bacillus subtilis]MBU8625271.1 hypothetical protein [Bacillus subtilis]